MKEIVITNPSGITLNTKKSLVDEDIKVKLGANLLGMKAKLVARGKVDLEKTDINHIVFNLTNKLEPNKLYLLTRLELDGYGEWDYCFFITYSLQEGTVHSLGYNKISTPESEGDTFVMSAVIYTYDNNYYGNELNRIEIVNTEYSLYWAEEDVVEIYELPIEIPLLLGGSE